MERYGIAIEFIDEKRMASKRDVARRLERWIKDKAQAQGVRATVESLNADHVGEEEAAVTAAAPRLLASVGGRELEWENGEDAPKQNFARWRAMATVTLSQPMDDGYARHLAEEARNVIRSQQMSEPQVSIYKLT